MNEVDKEQGILFDDDSQDVILDIDSVNDIKKSQDILIDKPIIQHFINAIIMVQYGLFHNVVNKNTTENHKLSLKKWKEFLETIKEATIVCKNLQSIRTEDIKQEENELLRNMAGMLHKQHTHDNEPILNNNESK